MWYFNADAGLCQEFFWGGCGGNPDNRFDAEAACLAACALPPANATGNATGDDAPLGPAVRRTVSGKECIDDSPVLGGCVDIAGVLKCRVAGGEYEECEAPVAGEATLDAALGEALPAAEPGPAAASAAEEHGHTHRGVPHEHQHAHPGAPPHAHEHIDAGHTHGDEGAEWAAASPAEEHGHMHDDVPHLHDHEHADGTVHQHAHDDAGHSHALPDHPEDAAGAAPRPEDLPDEGSEWEEPVPEPTEAEEPAPNCACTCCLPGQCDEKKQYRTYVEDREDCNVEMCGNRFYGCPNAGSHNDDAVVMAAFGAGVAEAEEPASAPAVDVGALPMPEDLAAHATTVDWEACFLEAVAGRPCPGVNVRPGDRVTFTWATNHNVVRLADQAAFDTCAGDTEELTAPSMAGTYEFRVPADAQPGDRIFLACTVNDHCALGQKVVLQVFGLPAELNDRAANATEAAVAEADFDFDDDDDDDDDDDYDDDDEVAEAAYCIDQDEDQCPLWAFSCECDRNPEFMVLNCPRSCGVKGCTRPEAFKQLELVYRRPCQPKGIVYEIEAYGGP